MYEIKGEGLFVGAGFIAEGWRVSDNLKKIGFNITPINQEVFGEEKRYRFLFEAGSNIKL